MSASSVFCSAIPVLPALDISSSVTFYEQQLGFARTFKFDDYAGLIRGSVEIHLWLCGNPKIPENTSCRINVSNIEQLYEEYQQANVIHPNGRLEHKPWGLKEFVILDLFGNAIHLTELVN